MNCIKLKNNKLKKDLQSKDGKNGGKKIESIKVGMETVEMDNVEVKKIESIKVGMETVEMDNVEVKKIESIKSELIDKINLLQNYFDNKIDDIETKNKKEIKSINDKIQLMRTGTKQQINKLERNVEKLMNGIFEMKIDNFDELKNNCADGICSECFYTRNRPYIFALRVFSLYGVNQLVIRLYIYKDAMNKYLSFPSEADVTIKIINENKREMINSITQPCKITEKKDNTMNEIIKFVYSISELTESGILESNRIIVECSVELKWTNKNNIWKSII